MIFHEADDNEEFERILRENKEYLERIAERVRARG